MNPNSSNLRLPIRWIHLSDFHVGKDNYASRKMFEYIIRHVEDQKSHGIIPDFIFLTGDLANRALPEEYETFWLEFLLPLQIIIGGDIQDRTFVVPGNHDVSRSKNPAFSRDEISSATSHYFDPNNEGLALREMLIPRFKNFFDADLSSAKNGIASEQGSFSQSCRIHGTDIGIVGINTAWLCKGEDDERNLDFGKPLLEKGLEDVSDTKIKFVLGHHPLDWIKPSLAKPLKSLLGKNQAIYLHGHMHHAWSEPTYGSGYPFLSIQTGAAFQARETEKWRNGLVWGEIDTESLAVYLQPWNWLQEHQTWEIITDAFAPIHRQGTWWVYNLPTPFTAQELINKPTAAPIPKGWSIETNEKLVKYEQPLNQIEALRFFDGAVPDWATALSKSIPRRSVVNKFLNHFTNVRTSSCPITALLLGAGCEGKTTSLLQSAYQFIEEHRDFKILHRRDESQPLDIEAIIPVLQPSSNWLILIDEADAVCEDLFRLFDALPDELSGKVHCMLACRDSDWRASRGDQINWASRSSFRTEILSGLEPEDSEKIVSAWGEFGDEALGDLSSVSRVERASLLTNQAMEEAKSADGAFFGALLTVRSGSDLRKHAHTMLERMRIRAEAGDSRLYDALFIISAMHAEGLEIMSRPVLAAALGIPTEKLHRNILLPLGQEAAATTTSSLIFTRHRRIAKTLVSIFENEFGEDLQGMFLKVHRSAMQLATGSTHVHIAELGVWRFRFMEHFLDNNHIDLALQIANSAILMEPKNSNVRTHAAKLFRRAGDASRAVQIFHEGSANAFGNRGFYYEWGAAEAEGGDLPTNIALVIYSLSDQSSDVFIENNQAMINLQGLGVAFSQLFVSYNAPVFKDAQLAAAIIGQTLRLDKAAMIHFERLEQNAKSTGAALPRSVDEALNVIVKGLKSAVQFNPKALRLSLFETPDNLSFAGLALLSQNSQTVNERKALHKDKRT